LDAEKQDFKLNQLKLGKAVSLVPLGFGAVSPYLGCVSFSLIKLTKLCFYEKTHSI